MKNSNYIEERDFMSYKRIATEIMFQLIQSGEEFSADDWFCKARDESMPPDLIKKLSGSQFKEYQASGYIEKTGGYILSKRNGSSPLPLWIATNHKPIQKKDGQDEDLKTQQIPF